MKSYGLDNSVKWDGHLTSACCVAGSECWTCVDGILIADSKWSLLSFRFCRGGELEPQRAFLQVSLPADPEQVKWESGSGPSAASSFNDASMLCPVLVGV